MTARTRRRRMRRAMLARRRRYRYTTTRHGVFETPTQRVTYHEIPRK